MWNQQLSDMTQGDHDYEKGGAAGPNDDPVTTADEVSTTSKGGCPAHH